MLHIAHVVKLEAPPALLVRVCFLILRLQRLVVDFGTGTQFVLGVGEEIMRAVAYEIRATDFGVGDAELGRALVGSAHELFTHKLLCSRVSMGYVVVGEEQENLPSSLRVSAAAMMCRIEDCAVES
jgi:hypothetical protein